jgi:hypothetical protein
MRPSKLTQNEIHKMGANSWACRLNITSVATGSSLYCGQLKTVRTIQRSTIKSRAYLCKESNMLKTCSLWLRSGQLHTVYVICWRLTAAYEHCAHLIRQRSSFPASAPSLPAMLSGSQPRLSETLYHIMYQPAVLFRVARLISIPICSMLLLNR